MEKEIGSKEVKLEAKKEQPQKLTYEQLNQACAELSQQNQNMQRYIQQLQKQMQQMDFTLQTKRMDYLFKVVELASDDKALYRFRKEFVLNCITEIEESLTIPQEETKDNPKED